MNEVPHRALFVVTFLTALGCGAVDAPVAPNDLSASADLPSANDATPSDARSASTDGGSPGCGKALSPGASEVSIVVGSATRSYIRVVPADYDANKPYPLFIGLHASGGTAQSGRSKLDLEAGAHEPALFVYPNGTPGASPSGERGWVLDADGADVAFYDALVAEQTNTACVDRARVVVVGFSNGGMFANVLACERASDLRMVVSVSSTPGPTTCRPDHVALLLAAGELDNLVTLATSQQVRDEAAARNGCTAPGTAQAALPCPANTTCSCFEYEGCLSGYPLTYCQHSGGHEYQPFVSPTLWKRFATLGPKP